MRPAIVFLSVFLPLSGAMPALAHDKYHFEGTVSGIQDSQLYVDVVPGKTISVALGIMTRIIRDDERVNASELHSGASVTVDALGHSETDLEATVVRFSPPALENN